jgi:hypothetical protein
MITESRCPACGRVQGLVEKGLAAGAALPTAEEALRKRLASDASFAERYRALNELALTGVPGLDLAEQAKAIVRDEPTLAKDLARSDREARRYLVKKRFKGRIQLGLLRRRDGPYRLLPEVLPERKFIHDRIFPQWDTLSWVLVPGKITQRGWRPTRKWLTKRVIAAMLEIKESTVDVLLQKGHLRRIPLIDAPLKNECCFWTEEVMTCPRIVAKMRVYQLPK